MAKKRPKTKKAPVSAAKAKKILKDGSVDGKPLTEKQKRFFGRIAGGAKRVRAPKKGKR